VAGIELVALRRGDHSLCVGRNWQIVFTLDARCTADEVDHGTHVIARNAAQARSSGPPPIAEGMDTSFFRSGHASSGP